MPQGSFLGLKFFIQYAEEFAKFFEIYEIYVTAPLAWNHQPTTSNLCAAQTLLNVSSRLFCMTLHTTQSFEYWTSFSLLLSCAIGLFVGGALRVHVIIVIA